MTHTKKQKFKTFLESLKGKSYDSLIESITQGFQVCYENEFMDVEDDYLSPFKQLQKKYGFPSNGLDANFSVEVMQVDDGEYASDNTYYISDDENNEIGFLRLNAADGDQNIDEIFTAEGSKGFEHGLSKRYEGLIAEGKSPEDHKETAIIKKLLSSNQSQLEGIDDVPVYREEESPEMQEYAARSKENKKKRYSATMDFYLWAENDESAINHAKAVAQERKGNYDDQSVILSIHSAPFGAIGGGKEIYKV